MVCSGVAVQPRNVGKALEADIWLNFGFVPEAVIGRICSEGPLRAQTTGCCAAFGREYRFTARKQTRIRAGANAHK